MPVLHDHDYFGALETASWPSDSEGRLNVDVIETDRALIVRTAVAGVKSEQLDVSVSEDTVTIRGTRQEPQTVFERQGVVHARECHWGAFSRSIVLPCHVRPDESDAVLKDGILTVTLQKAQRGGRLSIIDETDL